MRENTHIKEMTSYVVYDDYGDNTRISTVITTTDTIVIWSKYKYGAVIIERNPIK